MKIFNNVDEMFEDHKQERAKRKAEEEAELAKLSEQERMDLWTANRQIEMDHNSLSQKTVKCVFCHMEIEVGPGGKLHVAGMPEEKTCTKYPTEEGERPHEAFDEMWIVDDEYRFFSHTGIAFTKQQIGREVMRLRGEEQPPLDSERSIVLQSFLDIYDGITWSDEIALNGFKGFHERSIEEIINTFDFQEMVYESDDGHRETDEDRMKRWADEGKK